MMLNLGEETKRGKKGEVEGERDEKKGKRERESGSILEFYNTIRVVLVIIMA